MGHAPVTAFICISCRGKDAENERPGQLLFEAATASLRDRGACDVIQLVAGFEGRCQGSI
jgi:hypothetical protein